MKTQGMKFNNQWMVLVVAAFSMVACGKNNFSGTSSGVDASKVASNMDPGMVNSGNVNGDVVAVSPEAGTNGANAPVSPDLTSNQNYPQACGGGICFAGKSVTFTNDVGNYVITSISSVSPGGFTASFQTPAGRSMVLNFTIQGNQLITSVPKGWRPQFCYKHSNSNPCDLVNTAGGLEYNCSSALHWSGTYSGSTVSQQVMCPN